MTDQASIAAALGDLELAEITGILFPGLEESS
jgi:hypothetical protein